MSDLNLVLKIFRDLAARPAVSGLEYGNLEFVKNWAKQNNINFKLEELNGGLLFSRKDFPSLPSLVLTAHLDHPGFVLELLSEEPDAPRRYRAYPVGRIPADLLAGARVQLYSAADQAAVADRPAPMRGFGRIRKDKFSDGSENSDYIIDSESSDNGRATHAVYDLISFGVAGGNLYSRSIDDLLGCALCLACLLVASNGKINLTVLLTRGEEEGATGFKRILLSRKISPNDSIVSVEMSKYTDEAIPGKGIVIRSADKARFYSPMLVRFLEKVAKCYPELMWQAAGASDGQTESATAVGLGYEAAAVTIPLMAYHNVGSGKLAPESVSVFDIESAIQYLKVLIPAFPNHAASRSH